MSPFVTYKDSDKLRYSDKHSIRLRRRGVSGSRKYPKYVHAGSITPPQSYLLSSRLYSYLPKITSSSLHPSVRRPNTFPNHLVSLPVPPFSLLKEAHPCTLQLQLPEIVLLYNISSLNLPHTLFSPALSSFSYSYSSVVCIALFSFPFSVFLSLPLSISLPSTTHLSSPPLFTQAYLSQTPSPTSLTTPTPLSLPPSTSPTPLPPSPTSSSRPGFSQPLPVLQLPGTVDSLREKWRGNGSPCPSHAE